MKTILVVNGESYWQDILIDFKVVQKSIQHTDWIYRDSQLLVVDREGVVAPDGILWRVGAIEPTPQQTNAMNLITLANIPCVNDPNTLKLGFDRLSMLGIIKKQGLPVINFNVVTRTAYLKNIKKEFPFVVKVGNYHGGYGKVLIEEDKAWQDIQDLLFVTNHYITIEPYINYERDIRYIAVGNKVWAMSRRGKYWKANIKTTDYAPISPEEKIVAWTKKLQQHIGADILAIDILEESNGTLHIVEYNDIPGLSGFGEDIKHQLAAILIEKMNQ